MNTKGNWNLARNRKMTNCERERERERMRLYKQTNKKAVVKSIRETKKWGK
jgi:hypothetical protein